MLRVLRATETTALAAKISALTQDPLASAATLASLDRLRELFGTEVAAGSQMAVRATALLEDPATIAASCAALASDLLAAVKVPALAPV